MDDIAAQFRDPGPAYRGKPFWSWNGELDEAELIRQIHVMKEMGLGGFFMHSRTGLVTEYLGDEWFRLTNVCADEAARLGLEAWLYDEDRWPSGTAGGLVTEDPQYRLNYLSLRPVPGPKFEWDDAIHAAFACHLDGVSYTDCRRIFPDTPAAQYQNQTMLVFTREEMAPSSFYNGFTYADTLNRAATDRYIELTHARYRARCGDRLGAAIRGIFTDEPHRGAVFTGFSLDNANRLWMTPWTDALPARFAAQFGTDITDHLPELFLYPGGQAVSPIKWQYMELLQQMFLDNFARPLHDWCEANSLRLTGHALHEDSLTAQTAMQGSLMRFYECLHDPGVDVLTEGNRHFLIVKQLTSAARQIGQPWRLSELYGCTGWQMNFRSHKEAGDWQALLGINLRCHHLSWYTMEGEAKRDYPASILHQSAWWPDYAYVETYFARLGLFLWQGTPVCDLLVLNPVESVWCQIGVGWAEGLTPKTQAVRDLEDAYTEITTRLLNAHLDFDLGDEEMLGRLARIERAEPDGPTLHVGQAAYRAVVVGRHTTLRASTLRLLEAFHRAGGAVIFAGEPPPCVDAVPSDAPARLAAEATSVPWGEQPLIVACRASVGAGVQILHPDTGEPLTEVLCQLRADGEKRFLAAVNMSDTQPFAQAVIRLQGRGHVEEWDCRTGARFAVPSHDSGGDWVEFTADFPPSGERAFVLTPDRDSALPLRPAPDFVHEHLCDGPFAYTLSEPNVCVLDFARYRLGDGPWQERAEVLKVDRSIRQSLGLALRGGEMVQPWFQRKRHPHRPALARLTLAFDFAVDTLPDGPVHLALERPGDWQLTLNGHPVPTDDADGWWVDTAFRKVPLPADALQVGPNTLTLETEFHQTANIEAVYLLGAFGVRLDGPHATLIGLPAHLQIGDLTTQGLPFYGGAVTYRLPVPRAALGCPLRITTPAFEAACLKAWTDPEAPQIIAWPPYRADLASATVTLSLDAVLTRRNTFGPLHQVPLRAGAYGPHNFLTTGPAFRDSYQLYPAGLLAPPILAWNERAGAH